MTPGAHFILPIAKHYRKTPSPVETQNFASLQNNGQIKRQQFGRVFHRQENTTP